MENVLIILLFRLLRFTRTFCVDKTLTNFPENSIKARTLNYVSKILPSLRVEEKPMMNLKLHINRESFNVTLNCSGNC